MNAGDSTCARNQSVGIVDDDGATLLHASGAFPWFVRRGTTKAPEQAAPFLGDLIGADSEVDPLGLAVLLTLGFQIGSRTVVRDIERTGWTGAPAVVNSAHCETRCFPFLTPASRAPSQRDVYELSMQALRHAAKSGAPVLPLSGGKDSRMILLGLRALGIRPRVIVTAGTPRYSVDASIAKQLARRHGDPIEFVQPQSWSLDVEQWRHAAMSFESLEHGWFTSIALRVRALGGPVTDGIGAGVLSTGSLMKDDAIALWKAGRTGELAEWTVQHSAGVDSSFLEAARVSGLPIASSDEVLHEIVQVLEELRKYPNPLGSFSLFHWTRRGIAASAFGMLGRENVVAPWMDPGLCSALLAIELDQAAQHDWRDDVLKVLDQTGLPFADTVSPSGRRPPRSLRGALSWTQHRAQLPARLRPLSVACEASAGHRRTFGRAALVALSMLPAT
jgi:hypothetical protein